MYDTDFPEYGHQCELATPWRGYHRGTIVGKSGYRFVVELSSGAHIHVYEDEIMYTKMKSISDMNESDKNALLEAIKQFPPLSQEGKGKGAICFAVFALGSIRWFALEGAREGYDDIMFWGIVIGEDDYPAYYGHFSLSELLKRQLDYTDIGLPILRVRQQKRFAPAMLGKFRDRRLQSFLDKFP